MTGNQFMDLIVASILTLGSVGRLTRLVTSDTWPPVTAFRAWWHRITRDGSWSELVDCPWCTAPWVAAPVLATAVLWNDAFVWQIIAGWLTLSFFAALLITYDGE